jgi:hypothetical protein
MVRLSASRTRVLEFEEGMASANEVMVDREAYDTKTRLSRASATNEAASQDEQTCSPITLIVGLKSTSNSHGTGKQKFIGREKHAMSWRSK